MRFSGVRSYFSGAGAGVGAVASGVVVSSQSVRHRFLLFRKRTVAPRKCVRARLVGAVTCQTATTADFGV
jgi:hypothetical protein